MERLLIRVFRLVLAVPLVALVAASASAQVQVQGKPVVELELVLAIDLSASVNDAEYDLQRQGTAEAFRDPSVQEAIVAQVDGIAVIAVQWASEKYQRIAIPWTVLRTHGDIEAYADAVDVMPRKLPGGGTSIDGGLLFAARMFADSPVSGRRRVIDMAANGIADNLDKMTAARRKVLDAGIVINGLAIEELKQNLTYYFQEFVIGGPNAFVQTAWSFEDFREAMRAKLIREIGGPRVVENETDAYSDG